VLCSLGYDYEAGVRLGFAFAGCLACGLRPRRS